jgi:hypothetical protein
MQKPKELKKKWINEGKKIGRKIGLEKGYKKGYDEGYVEGRTQVVREILEKLQAGKTNPQLAKTLGVKSHDVYHWLAGQVKTSATIEKIIESIVNSTKRQTISDSYNTIAEMKSLKARLSKQGGSYDMVIGKNENESKNIEKKLKAEYGGLYIFYDSLGKAIYAGKTEIKKKNGKVCKNSLWDEMKSAFNRERKSQIIFRSNDSNKNTRITKQYYYLYETACYVSAYKVDELAISDFEALIIRSFPNDLTNVRMETKNKIETLFLDGNE